MRTALRAHVVALCALLGATPGACATSPSSTEPARSPVMHVPSFDLANHPELHFRIDAFAVPEAARAEVEAAMRRNLAFLQTLPGFRGHVVFEKKSGPSTFDLITIAEWESAEALQRAGEQVRAHYQRIGFDLPASLERWWVKAELGNYVAPPRLQ